MLFTKPSSVSPEHNQICQSGSGNGIAAEGVHQRDLSVALSPAVLARVQKLARRRGLSHAESAFYLENVAGRAAALDKMLSKHGLDLQPEIHDALALRHCLRPGTDKSMALSLDSLKQVIRGAETRRLDPELSLNLQKVAINHASQSSARERGVLSASLRRLLAGRVAVVEGGAHERRLSDGMRYFVRSPDLDPETSMAVDRWYVALKVDVRAALVAANMGVPDQLLERVWSSFHPRSPEMALIFEVYPGHSRPSPDLAILSYVSLRADWLHAADGRHSA